MEANLPLNPLIALAALPVDASKIPASSEKTLFNQLLGSALGSSAENLPQTLPFSGQSAGLAANAAAPSELPRQSGNPLPLSGNNLPLPSLQQPATNDPVSVLPDQPLQQMPRELASTAGPGQGFTPDQLPHSANESITTLSQRMLAAQSAPTSEPSPDAQLQALATPALPAVAVEPARTHTDTSRQRSSSLTSVASPGRDFAGQAPQQPIAGLSARTTQQPVAEFASTVSRPEPVLTTAEQAPGALPVVKTAPDVVSAAFPALLNTPNSPQSTPVQPVFNVPQHALQDPGWGDAVGRRIQWMIGGQVDSAEIRLHPAELGNIQVRVEVGVDGARIDVQAANKTTQELMETLLPRLLSSLDSNGIKTDEVKISHNEQAGNNNLAREGQRQAEQQSGRHGQLAQTPEAPGRGDDSGVDSSQHLPLTDVSERGLSAYA